MKDCNNVNLPFYDKVMYLHTYPDGWAAFKGTPYIFICDDKNIVVWSESLNQARLHVNKGGYTNIIPMGKSTLNHFV